VFSTSIPFAKTTPGEYMLTLEASDGFSTAQHERTRDSDAR
jgi:hypothetical protein